MTVVRFLNRYILWVLNCDARLRISPNGNGIVSYSVLHNWQKQPELSSTMNIVVRKAVCLHVPTWFRLFKIRKCALAHLFFSCFKFIGCYHQRINILFLLCYIHFFPTFPHWFVTIFFVVQLFQLFQLLRIFGQNASNRRPCNRLFNGRLLKFRNNCMANLIFLFSRIPVLLSVHRFRRARWPFFFYSSGKTSRG